MDIKIYYLLFTIYISLFGELEIQTKQKAF